MYPNAREDVKLHHRLDGTHLGGQGSGAHNADCPAGRSGQRPDAPHPSTATLKWCPRVDVNPLIEGNEPIKHAHGGAIELFRPVPNPSASPSDHKLNLTVCQGLMAAVSPLWTNRAMTIVFNESNLPEQASYTLNPQPLSTNQALDRRGVASTGKDSADRTLGANECRNRGHYACHFGPRNASARAQGLAILSAHRLRRRMPRSYGQYRHDCGPLKHSI